MTLTRSRKKELINIEIEEKRQEEDVDETNMQKTKCIQKSKV